MKVNKRGLHIIAFIILLFLIIKIIFAFLSEFTIKREDYNELLLNYDNMFYNLKNKQYYEELEYKLLNEKNNFNFQSNIKQEDILKIIYKYVPLCDINLTKLSFSDTFQAETEVIDEQIPVVQIITVNIEFNSKYVNMLDFIDELQSNYNYLAVTNLSANFLEDIVYVTMSINFYLILDAVYNN